MGNQTSQWFALFYLDPLDRLVKEKLRIKYYIRYMDDCILVHHSKEALHQALSQMRELVESLGLSFNEKTQVFPIYHGVEYLGWRFYLTETGAVVRRLKKHSKIRWKHRLRKLKALYHWITILFFLPSKVSPGRNLTGNSFVPTEVFVHEEDNSCPACNAIMHYLCVYGR